MGTYRARTNCPECNDEQEFWFTNMLTKEEQPDYIVCDKCETTYNSKHFVSTFLNLRNNNTVSTKGVSDLIYN